jgi:hypothetical protein
LWLYAVNAALIALDNVLGALDTHSRAEHRLKQLQLSRTKSLTSIRRRANRAVILNEEITALTFLPDLGHVAFFASNLRERRQFLFQRISGPDSLAVIGTLSRTT